MKRKNLIKGALILFALAGLYISSATFSASASSFFTGTGGGPISPPLVTAPPSAKCEYTYSAPKNSWTSLQEAMEDCYTCTYGEAQAGPPDTENNEVTYTYVGTSNSQTMHTIACIQTTDENDSCSGVGFTGSKEPLSCPDFSWTQPNF